MTERNQSLSARKGGRNRHNQPRGSPSAGTHAATAQPGSAAGASSDTGSVEVSSQHPGSDADATKVPPEKEPKKIVLPHIPSSNLLVIDRRWQNIAGTWLLDPAKTIPPSLLPNFIGPPVERPTLLLRSRSGNVTADIWLAAVSAANNPAAKIDISSIGVLQQNLRFKCVVMLHSVGTRTVHLHIGGVRTFNDNDPSQEPYEAAPPDVDLLLPSDFTGCVLLDNCKTVIASGSLSKRLTQFSDEQKSQTWFLGDWESTGFGHGEWEGSSVRVRGDVVRIGVTESDEQFFDAVAPLGPSAISTNSLM